MKRMKNLKVLRMKQPNIHQMFISTNCCQSDNYGIEDHQLAVLTDNLPGLRKLNISSVWVYEGWNKLTDRAVGSVVSLRLLEHLDIGTVAFNFGCNQISDEGALLLTGLPVLTHLSLSFDCCVTEIARRSARKGLLPCANNWHSWSWMWVWYVAI